MGKLKIVDILIRLKISVYCPINVSSLIKLKVPKMRYVFQVMVLRPGGMVNTRAVLHALLDAWWKVSHDNEERD